MRYKAKNLKPKVKRKFKPGRKMVIVSSIVLSVCIIGGGVWYYLGHNSSEPVYVYPFQYIGMTEYWGDSQESSGPVTTDKIQTVFLTETQTVTEICVKEGDQVKKGDLLMTFDTTLDDLALERKRLEVEKLKLQLEDAKQQLKEINSMEPMEIPDFDFGGGSGGEGLGWTLDKSYMVSDNKLYDGSTPEKALICWLKGETPVDDGLFEAIRNAAEEYQNENAAEGNEPTDPTDPEETTEPTGPDETTKPTDPDETSKPTDPDETTKPTDPDETTKPTDPDETSKPTDPDETTKPTDPDETTKPTAPDETSKPADTGENIIQELRIPSSASAASETPDEGDTPDERFPVNDYYAVLKITAENKSEGQLLTWQGFHVTKRGGSFSFKLFDASFVPNHFPETGGEMDSPGIFDMPDFGSGLTAAQIAQMRSEQQKKIKDLDFEIKMADADYKIMQTEISDGNIYSTIDGSVISLLTEEEARENQQPVLKVSGGGGFYVEGAVNELDKDLLKIGQEVTINNWRGGNTYTGTVQSIGDFPNLEDSWNGMGNPNASYYPFQVFVDESADLQEGGYVSVVYSAAAGENGIYLQNPFIRSEQGRSYVLLKGENGRLEKRFITTGKALWGSYTEVLSGITEEDLIAFPYGKNVKPGVAVQEGDMSNLYG